MIYKTFQHLIMHCLLDRSELLSLENLGLMQALLKTFLSQNICKKPFGDYIGINLWKPKITFYLFPKVFLARLFIPYSLVLYHTE